MDSTAFTKLPQSLNHQDPGTMAKKKKEKENRNSMTQEVLSDWNQKETWVIITIVTGPNHDVKKANVDCTDNHVSITLGDNRRYATKLYENVVQDMHETYQKGNKFIVKLMKHDPSIHWPSLEPSPSTRINNKNHNNNNVNQNNNYNNNRRHSNQSSITKASRDSQKQEEDKVSADVHVLHPQKLKTDFAEIDGNKITVYVYVKKLNRETAKVNILKDQIVMHFSSSDSKFLDSVDGSTEYTVFQLTIPLSGCVVPDLSDYKLSPSKVEIRLSKEVPGAWHAISPITKTAPAGSGESSKSSEEAQQILIPPAPPAPPPAAVQAKKPTCLVSPSSNQRMGDWSSSSYNSQTAMQGYMGLDNIGNTCFMNSVLQTLLNTRELRDYFIMDPNNALTELNVNNPLGQGGRLAVAFAVLMKVAWVSNYRTFAPTKLKAVMSLKANQFSGFAQHDAQEFMVELLDGLHEDLNRIKEKPYFAEPPELDGWSDNDAAAESWRLHKLRNDSIIDDLFKGQFRSTLTCHECGKISLKFDEFCCLSVPIPKDQKMIEVLFFYKDMYQQLPLKVTVSVNSDASVEELLQDISRKVQVHPSSIKLLEVYKHRVQKLFQRGASLSSVTTNDVLMAFEVITSAQIGGEEVVEVCVTQRLSSPSRPTQCAQCGRQGNAGLRIQRCTKCLTVGYCSTECQKNHWTQHTNQCRFVHEVVGAPFIISLPKSHATYSTLARTMEGYARHSVDIFQPPVASPLLQQPSRAGAARGRRMGSTSSVESSDEDRMEVESSDRISGAEEVKEEDLLNFRPNTVNNDWGAGQVLTTPPKRGNKSVLSKGSICVVPPLVPYPNAATQLFTMAHVSSRGQSLPDCPRIADQEDEPLDLEDNYYIAMDWKTYSSSPKDVVCLIKNKDVEYRELQRGPTTRSSMGRQQTTLQACMDLFTQPENLSEGDSWRCPRCKKPVEATKQMCLWKLPPVLIVQLKRFSFKYVLYSDKIDKFVDYPVKAFDVSPHIADNGGDGGSTLYDLYGVVNHMGRLLGGHYTAYARTLSQDNASATDIDWRLFDDSRVSSVVEDRVVNDQAYLLLYRRRGALFTVPRHLGQQEGGGIDTSSNIDMENYSNIDIDIDSTSNVNMDTSNIVITDSVSHRNGASFNITIDNSNRRISSAMDASNQRTVIYQSGGAADHSSIVSVSGLGHNDNVGDHVAPNIVQDDQPSSSCQIASKSYDDFLDSSTTSMINTNDSMCGNLVSNIHIEDCAVAADIVDTTSPLLGAEGNSSTSNCSNNSEFGASSEATCIQTDFLSRPFNAGCSTATAFRTNPSTLFGDVSSSSGSGASRTTFSSGLPGPTSSGLQGPTSSGVAGPTSSGLPGPTSSSIEQRSVFSSAADVTGGVVLDEVTPMSVSSTSQPSLSSTEEESISTAQEELD